VIRHHYTLEHIARALTDLAGASVVEVYTQEKFSIVLRLSGEHTEHTLSVSVDPSVGCITLLDAAHRARKNTLDVFPALLGQTLAAATKHPDDRIITLWFSSHQLHVQLYSAARGNMLLVRDGIIEDALRERSAVSTPFTIVPYVAQEFASYPGTTTIEKALSQCELLLGPYYARDVCARLSLEPSTRVEALDPAIVKAAWQQGVKVRDEARASTSYYMLTRNEDVIFSLIPLNGYVIARTSESIFPMLRSVIGMQRSYAKARDLRKRRINDLERSLHRAQRSIHGMTSDAATADRSTAYRLHGSLLLSLPPTTDIGRSHVDAVDYEGSPVSIALDPKKTVIENAHVYFAKARASDEASRVRAIRLPALQRQCSHLEQELQRIRSATLEELQQMAHGPDPAKNTDEVTKKYRVFVLDSDYTLFVGKSAANNDELTMKFAKQNDLWFHARGVSGSHAVLRGPEPEHPPKKILEQAAAIAAYYSNARNASYTPVVYTLKKYVRKPKGANVGAVTLEREKVIMVKPAIPEGTAE